MMWKALLASLVMVATISGTTGQQANTRGHQYNSLGCWNPDPLPLIEGLDSRLNGDDWTIRENAIQKCFQAACHMCFTVFGLDENGRCRSSATAPEDYDDGGMATGCEMTDGRGWTGAMEVYQVSNQHEHICRNCRPQNPRTLDCCLDIVFVQDDSSSIRQSLFTSTKQYMIDFTRCFNSFDDHVGAILYNCEARTEIGLLDYTIGDLGLEIELANLTQDGGITRTGPAIRYMRGTTNFRPENMIRRVAIVLTDGYVQGYPFDVTVAAAATAAGNAGITLYSVAVGDNADNAVLGQIGPVYDDTNPCNLYDRILLDICPGNGQGNNNAGGGGGGM